MTHESVQTPSHGAPDAHPELPTSTPRQMIIATILAFGVPVAIIALLANWAVLTPKPGAGSDALSPAAIEKRIAPVASFVLVDANAPKVLKTGEQVFQGVCSACHTAGVAGAPKMGDTAAWAPRLQTGFEALLGTVLHGKGAMPPKGGNPALSDYEIARAVVFMANKSGGNLPEPPEPAAPAK